MSKDRITVALGFNDSSNQKAKNYFKELRKTVWTYIGLKLFTSWKFSMLKKVGTTLDNLRTSGKHSDLNELFMIFA